MDLSELVRVGTVSGVHGVHGWLKVHSFTEQRVGIFDYFPWVLEHRGISQIFEYVAQRVTGKTLLARLQGLDTRDLAEQWVGANIYIHADKLPRLEGTQYYWRDLIGCMIADSAGNEIGVLVWMIATGANDVMVVDADGEEVLIPWVINQVVTKVDIDARRIEVDWSFDHVSERDHDGT